jgi:hypothetical protein
VSEDSCSEIKQPERDADSSSPSSADIKNECVASATGHLGALMAYYGISKENLTFCILFCQRSVFSQEEAVEIKYCDWITERYSCC